MRIEINPIDVPRAPEAAVGSLNCAVEVRVVLNQAIKSSPRTREEIAARMSEITGSHITKAQLDAWTGESKTKHRFPLEYAAAFEEACGAGCSAVRDLLGRKRGSRLLAGKDALYLELGRIFALEGTTLEERKQHIYQLLRGEQKE